MEPDEEKNDSGLEKEDPGGGGGGSQVEQAPGDETGDQEDWREADGVNISTTQDESSPAAAAAAPPEVKILVF